MQIQMSEIVDKHFPRRETVLLRFNKLDSQIVRNWSKPDKAKDSPDDSN